MAKFIRGLYNPLYVGYKQEYMLPDTLNVAGVIIKLGNSPTTAQVEFTFSVNGLIQADGTNLFIPVGQDTVNFAIPLFLLPEDIIKFECSAVSDPIVGDPVFWGVYE